MFSPRERRPFGKEAESTSILAPDNSELKKLRVKSLMLGGKLRAIFFALKST